jgi:serine protease Do
MFRISKTSPIFDVRKTTYMNKFLLSLAIMLVTVGYINAQSKADQKELERSKEELKRSEKEYKKAEKAYKKSLKDYDEIVIKRKDNDKDAKVTVEIHDDEVFVDGKPLEDYVNNEVSVRLRSPQHFNLNMNGDSPFTFSDPGEEKAFLGVMTEGSKEGAIVTMVSENSAAAKAGLQKGDVINKVNGKPVYDHEQLTAIISEMKPDEKAEIDYKRDGKSNKTTATLGKRKADIRVFRGQGAPGAPVPPLAPMPPMEFNFDGEQFGDIFKYRNAGKPRLGIKAQDTEEGKGVKVLDVDDESAAETAGIKEDDIITSFDGKEVNSAEELAKASRESKDKSSVEVKLKRDGKSKTITLKIPRKLKTAEL